VGIVLTTKVCICPGCRSRVNIKSYYYETHYTCPKCGKKNFIIVIKECTNGN